MKTVKQIGKLSSRLHRQTIRLGSYRVLVSQHAETGSWRSRAESQRCDVTSSAYTWPNSVSSSSSSSWITLVTYNSLHVAVRSLSVTLRPWFRCLTPCWTMSHPRSKPCETLWSWFRCLTRCWTTSTRVRSPLRLCDLGSDVLHPAGPCPPELEAIWDFVTLVQMSYTLLDHVPPEFEALWDFVTLVQMSYTLLDHVPHEFEAFWDCDLGSDVLHPAGPRPPEFEALGDFVTLVQMSYTLLDHVPSEFEALWDCDLGSDVLGPVGPRPSNASSVAVGNLFDGSSLSH